MQTYFQHRLRSGSILVQETRAKNMELSATFLNLGSFSGLSLKKIFQKLRVFIRIRSDAVTLNHVNDLVFGKI